MAKHSSPRKLALELAQLAADIRVRHGDISAQAVPYALLVRRWDSSVDVAPMLDGFDDHDALSRIEASLDSADTDAVRACYASQGRDPTVYFYEEFIRACDPQTARKRGVLYTPPEVVTFILRGIQHLLQDRFGLALGDACMIDPCCGVGTFLRQIEDRPTPPGSLIGLELMPAACRIAQCLVPNSCVRQADWLTNLELDTGEALPVIVGNPPYSGHSSNAGKIADLMADYREGLHERNPKWLQDDYVKFIRMAQHRIDSAGRGIVAFITNHSYLFNPTFRAMRRSLTQSFDEILVLDLGGNIRKLDGPDENVFPIRMGVAISFMVKTGSDPKCNVRHAEIAGARRHKLDTLASSSIETLPWTSLPPAGSFLLFTPHDETLREEFYSFASLFDLFREHTMGFVTSRDAFAVGFTRDEVLSRVDALRSGRITDGELRAIHHVGNLNIDSARDALRSDPNWEDNITEVLYRPLDRRWIYYSRAIMERPRLPFMQNMLRDNIALAVGRAGQVVGSEEWDVVFCSDRPADLNLFRRGGAKLFPKYVYEDGRRVSNMAQAEFDSETLFAYIYAVLHSSAYRRRYADMLRVDYPRIPVSLDQRLVCQLAEVGNALISVHLMRLSPSDITNPQGLLRVGGYELPRKVICERGHWNTPADLALLASAVDRTITLRRQIDRIMSHHPPWPV